MDGPARVFSRLAAVDQRHTRVEGSHQVEAAVLANGNEHLRLHEPRLRDIHREVPQVPEVPVDLESLRAKTELAPIIENLQFFPILRVDWHITAASQVRFGLQGFPLLKDFRRDRVNDANDSDRTSWTIMWFNESEYEGYIVGTEVGLTRRDVDFNQRNQADTRFTRFFVRIISAVGSVVR